MKSSRQSSPREVTAIKVHQWLKPWDKVVFDKRARRSRPEPHFYLFTLSASDLKALSGIYRRTTERGQPRSSDPNIQRQHDRHRSDRIRDFIEYGYPLSDLSPAKRESPEFNDLLKPGWLPTAVVVNILKAGDKRLNRQIDSKDVITIQESDEHAATIQLPKQFAGSTWKPSAIHPIEVIDGQHRLWAFDEDSPEGNFELPVVAYHGLDISWQAYLFWSINITPKRINASLAFDLYPLLRTEDWLERFEGHSIYRETRAQELTEALWGHPESPWYQRINMLGETGLPEKMVSQAAWIRSLMTTYVKAFEGKGIAIGGLFGAPVGSHEQVLPWNRAQQAAFLIRVGQKFSESVSKCRAPWAERLRAEVKSKKSKPNHDPAFAGPYTLLNTDQGVRGMLYVTNDLCYVRVDDLKLSDWEAEGNAGAADEREVSGALATLKKKPVDKFLGDIAESLATYDWRTSGAPGLTEEEQLVKGAFRGGGGYKTLRHQLLLHLARSAGDVGKAAKNVLNILGYSKA